MGEILATGLEEISNDPEKLKSPGFWSVSTTFEGEWSCARWGQVQSSPFPDSRDGWQGIRTPWQSTQSRSEYIAYVEEIRRLISQGEVYQVNACREISAAISSHSLWPLMTHLLVENPSPYASFLKLPDIEIASSSPELFLRIHDRDVTSAPIKGTKSATESGIDFGKKDIAENIMIVDLIRNDLGRISETGSVDVPQLLATESHPGLSHLVSYVHGKLQSGVTWSQIADALLPPGSVSGAPKSSAVEIIRKEEGRPRGPYCGALGWVNGDEALFSLAIRIFWSNRDGVLRFGTGAGITWGSVAEEEWEETELKARHLLGIAEKTFNV